MAKRVPYLHIPVIDLFAGPGGLGEGFSTYLPGHQFRRGRGPFRTALSIEMDPVARETLKLRSFFRELTSRSQQRDYFGFLSKLTEASRTSLQPLYDRYPEESRKADWEAWNAELGSTVPGSVAVYNRIEGALKVEKASGASKHWVLIGGPPCQAYSLVGRSRNKGNKDYTPADDHRHFLYKEYLKVLAEHRPAVFVMENVKGLLSAQLDGEPIFSKIVKDLENSGGAFPGLGYTIYGLNPPCNGSRKRQLKQGSFLHDGEQDGNVLQLIPTKATDYVVRAEKHGIPQARHRVILIGVRNNLGLGPAPLSNKSDCVTVEQVLSGLPSLRSGLSRTDSEYSWRECLSQTTRSAWFRRGLKSVDPDIRRVYNRIGKVAGALKLSPYDRGANSLEVRAHGGPLDEWYTNSNQTHCFNHCTRGHIPADLHRYLFASCFAKEMHRSPDLSEFPPELLPLHQNVTRALKQGALFGDRFRVQVADRPSTTVTSHISKDGHYYIHYDPTQCRSLTVREAARLQTFPDDYYFVGPRTEQYRQVGNAVPPLLARQIADAVYNILLQAR